MANPTMQTVSEFNNPNLEIMLTTDEIRARINELGAQITQDYAGRKPLLLGVLKGATLFLSDLIRAVDLQLELDYIAASSYGGGTESSGDVKIDKDSDVAVRGRDVIVIEDIIDTGRTLSLLLSLLRARGAASVKLAALLDKPSRRVVDVKVDYIGFTIPDAFVVGYGLDFAERYRNLPYIGVVKDPSA
jgi:hypoxanthine phosphoribosyltransferase